MGVMCHPEPVRRMQRPPPPESHGAGTQRRGQESDYILTLQKEIGPVTVLVTFELPLVTEDGRKVLINAGNVVPRGVASESGIQVVTPVGQRGHRPGEISPGLLKLNPLELPAEDQLHAPPPIATYQYSGTARPFDFPIGWTGIEWNDHRAGRGVSQGIHRCPGWEGLSLILSSG